MALMPRKAPRIDDPELLKQLREALQRGALGWADSCRFMRASQGLTQAEFAARVGVAVKVIKELENDSGNPTLASLNRIAESFGLRVGFIHPTSLVSLGTAEIVRQRSKERLASLRELKQGKTTLKKLHSKNALRGSDFTPGLPKLS